MLYLLTRPHSLIIAVTIMLLFSCQQESQNIALGTLERERVAHTATINEVVIQLPINEGKQVVKGDILVKLDDTQQNAQVAKALAIVQQSSANLEKLRNGAREEEVSAASAKVAGANALVKKNKANFARAKNLAKSNLASQATLDSSLALYDESLANLRSAKELLRELTNGTRVEDLAIAEATLASSQATLASEQKRLADLTIRATRKGLLDSLPWNLGERVTAGSPVAIVLAGDAPFARVYVPEKYRVKIHAGDQLKVRVDGIKEDILGQVISISNEPAFTPYYALNQKERARLMYLMKVQLPNSASKLPSGIPAQVELPK